MSRRPRKRGRYAEDLEEKLWDLHIVPLNAEPAPAFALESLAEKRIALSALRGRVVMRAVTQAYRVTGVPKVVLVGRQGDLIGRAVGTRQWTGEKGRGLFEALLSPRTR